MDAAGAQTRLADHEPIALVAHAVLHGDADVLEIDRHAVTEAELVPLPGRAGREAARASTRRRARRRRRTGRRHAALVVARKEQCQRVAVMRHGRIVRMIDRAHATQERLTAYCYSTGARHVRDEI
jgi:hypothetical protein